MEKELPELLGRTVDLNTPGFLSPAFRDEVVKESETQYECEETARLRHMLDHAREAVFLITGKNNRVWEKK
jgi:hypothetical protein